MRTSAQFTTVARALFLAREQVGTITKEGWNPDTKSRYASLNLVVAVVQPALNANGLLVLQGVSSASPDNAFDVTTTFVHVASGEWIEEMVRVPLVGRRSAKVEGGFYPLDPQAGGSALTYGKRYGLLAAMLLVADEDDDGEGARPRTVRAVEAARRDEHTDQYGQQLIPGIMPVGGATQKGKPIADMTLQVLRQALVYCRTNNKKAEARIIATELTRRSLSGDKKAEQQLRNAAREDDTVAEVVEEARLKQEDEQTTNAGGA